MNGQRTEQEQVFWDRIFADQFPICVKKLRNARGLAGCAHDAMDAANESLKARRQSIADDAGAGR